MTNDIKQIYQKQIGALLSKAKSSRNNDFIADCADRMCQYYWTFFKEDGEQFSSVFAEMAEFLSSRMWLAKGPTFISITDSMNEIGNVLDYIGDCEHE